MSSRRHVHEESYPALVDGLSALLESARRTSARAVNAIMTATYWQVGRRIVEHEQAGARRAEYGTQLLARLSVDLTKRFGRGFSRDSLEVMRRFYLAFPRFKISETPSRKSVGGSRPTPPLARPGSEPPLMKASLDSPSDNFPLPWSHYVLLLRKARSAEAFQFYHAEALRGGWSVRQLDRQVSSQFYERTALSKTKAALLARGSKRQAGDEVSVEGEVRDPLVLEFLGLKDEYSESELEETLVHHLEAFLLELGGHFAFIRRQRRLRIGDEWYRIDLLMFQRVLRCLVVIDLKVGQFTHADAGQMHLYLNYAREHWTQPRENPPVGLILCSQKNDALAHYALDGLPSQVLAREYRLALPQEQRLAAELARVRKRLDERLTPERD